MATDRANPARSSAAPTARRADMESTGSTAPASALGAGNSLAALAIEQQRRSTPAADRGPAGPGKQALNPASQGETHAPLDSAKAQHFGAQLGADFSGVQVHTGDGVANDHGAAAVAFGRDIHVADGLPHGPSDALLGHELVHMVQQGAVPTRDGAPLTQGSASAAEAEAHRLGPAVADGMAGRVTVGAPAGIHRTPRRPAAATPPHSEGDSHHARTDTLLAKAAGPASAAPARPIEPKRPPAQSHPPTGGPRQSPAAVGSRPAKTILSEGLATRQAASQAASPPKLRAAPARPAPHPAIAAAPPPPAATPAAPAISATAPGAAVAHRFVGQAQQHAARLRAASQDAATAIRARAASEASRVHAEHARHCTALDAQLAAGHGMLATHEHSAHAATDAGHAAAHAHLATTGHAQSTRVEHAGAQQRTQAAQIAEQHGGDIDAAAVSDATRFAHGSAARTRDAQQGGGGGNSETADERAQTSAKIGDRAATNFAADSSKVSGETHRAASEFHGHLHEGTANFLSSVDQVVPHVIDGVTGAVSATQAGASDAASQARGALSSIGSHARAQLTSDAAAAHGVLQHATDAITDALHQHAAHSAVQTEAGGQGVAAALLEQAYAVAPVIAAAPVRHATVAAAEADGQLAQYTDQVSTEIAAIYTRVAGGLAGHTSAESAELAATASQAGTHLQGAAERVGKHMTQSGAHIGAALHAKAQLAAQQIQETAGQATDKIGSAGAEHAAKAQRMAAQVRGNLSGVVGTAESDQQTNLGTFHNKRQDAAAQIDAKHDQLKTEGDHRSASEQSENASQAQTFLSWLLPKSWTNAIKRWFARTFGEWFGGFLYGLINALITVVIVVAICAVAGPAAPFIVGGLLLAGAGLSIYSRFKQFEADHSGRGPGLWQGAALVGLGIADITGIPSIVEGLAGERAFGNGAKLEPFEAGEAVGGGLGQLAGLIFGGARALRGRGGGGVKPAEPAKPGEPAKPTEPARPGEERPGIDPTSMRTQKLNELADRLEVDFKNDPLRQAYESEVNGLRAKADALIRQRGTDPAALERTAREMVQERRDLGVKYKDKTPEPLRDYIYDANKSRYEDPLGPSWDFLMDKYKGDYMKIIDAATRPNPDINSFMAGFRKWLLEGTHGDKYLPRHPSVIIPPPTQPSRDDRR